MEEGERPRLQIDGYRGLIAKLSASTLQWFTGFALFYLSVLFLFLSENLLNLRIKDLDAEENFYFFVFYLIWLLFASAISLGPFSVISIIAMYLIRNSEKKMALIFFGILLIVAALGSWTIWDEYIPSLQLGINETPETQWVQGLTVYRFASAFCVQVFIVTAGHLFQKARGRKN